MGDEHHDAARPDMLAHEVRKAGDAAHVERGEGLVENPERHGAGKPEAGERDAAALLAEYCRSDMSRISGEFGKLASYRMGGRITPDDVRLMVQPEPEYAMWQLSGAIAAKNAAEAMKIYESFDEDARRPETLFGVVQSHFRRLYYSLTEDGETVKKLLGVRDNALYAIKREAAKFGEAALARILLSLAETDEDIKNGTLPRETASEVLILRTVGGI